MVYGSPLTVPGDFTEPNDFPYSLTVPEHLQTMRGYMSASKPMPMSHHGRTAPYVPNVLLSSPFVFIRTDSHRSPLACPYTGPYRVLEHGDKHFVIVIGTRRETVYIDRLKPAFMDALEPAPVAQPPRRGRPPRALPANQPATVPRRPPPANLSQPVLPERTLPQQPAAPLRSGRVPRPVRRFQS